MNAQALFFKLVDGEVFLEHCFREALRHATDIHPKKFQGLALVAVDATVLCGPGSKGTDQRLHAVYELSTGTARSIDLTGPEGGEKLSRHASFGKGDLVLADRGYGHANGVKACLASGARLLVRFEFGSIRLIDEESGQPISGTEAKCRMGARERHVEISVRLPNCDTPLRALGSLTDKAEIAWLLTDLTQEELPVDEGYELYRKRWQIELFFKRLKSILDLGELPTRDGPTAKSWIWAKLLLATLATLLGGERFSPSDQGTLPLEELLSGTPQSPLRDPKPKKNKAKTTTQTPTLATNAMED